MAIQKQRTMTVNSILAPSPWGGAILLTVVTKYAGPPPLSPEQPTYTTPYSYVAPVYVASTDYLAPPPAFVLAAERGHERANPSKMGSQPGFGYQSPAP